MSDFKVGDRVFAIKELREAASGDAPGGTLARFGDELEIVETLPWKDFQYSVRHPGVKGRFYVKAGEISRMRHFEHNLFR